VPSCRETEGRLPIERPRTKALSFAIDQSSYVCIIISNRWDRGKAGAGDFSE
jgi:hypothetical protein